MNKSYVYKVYWNIFRLFIIQTFFGRGRVIRNKEKVTSEYGEAWSETIGDLLWGRKLRVQKIGQRLVICRAIDSRKFFLSYLSSTVSSFAPESILELGSGIGINLLVLAVLNPGIKKLRGIELTENGLHHSKNILQKLPIKELVYLTELSEKVIRERLSNRDIEFVQGNILCLPFEDKSFDFVFSMWVLEQNPVEYPKAFMEARRVIKDSGNASFIEEFIEAQENFFQRLHLRNVDYFHASYTEVVKAGFDVLRFEPMPMSKIKLTYGIVVCEASKI